MKIKSIDDLREYILDVMNDLKNKNIELDHASVAAKLSETVISGLKTQLEYARLLESAPKIEFMGNCTAIKDVTPSQKKLLSKS